VWVRAWRDDEVERVRGIVLAAGAGRRLQPLTFDLPKTLLPVTEDDTILDLVLANLAEVDITDIVLVVGFAASQVQNRLRHLSVRHGVRLRTVFNHRATIWNNAFSLYLAGEFMSEGAIICNGDTVHPPSVERTLLASRGPEVLLAIDDRKQLAEEEMKVVLDPAGRLARINKAIDPADAAGEYIGVTLVEDVAAERLTEALMATWKRDPGLYYEDGYQEFAERGGEVRVAPIGDVAWVEVDNHDDLARARELACRY
jgi:choline kinase